MTRSERTVDVLIVGAGPAGLTAASRLAGVGAVEVLEREAQTGGIPRHCHLGGFGLRTGPQYARRLTGEAARAGARLRTSVTVTDWAGPRTLDTTGPHGLERITARAVVLATGARERPRSARLVPGTRPAGVLTTGELQQTVHLHGRRPGTRAVVVGAEPVAHSAVRTLLGAGVEVAAMVTDLPHHQAPPTDAADTRLRRGVPLLTRTTVAELLGRGRLSGVAIRHADGREAVIACDTVVFTGDFVPENELPRRGGLLLDPGTRGPTVDPAFRTTGPGVFAAGNLLHGAEPALSAAREGARAAAAVLRHLDGAPWPAEQIPVRAEDPLLWVAPQRISPGSPHHFLLRTAQFLTRAHLVVRQDGRILHHQRLPRTVVPNRSLTISGNWVDRADPRGGTVIFSTEQRST
ncbi:NAD(P)/FAD-dependent oxidoreductase [Streptomyces sp. NBC_01465]|uniref:NAD(P)/FAD-dependent oxidoreductase n=1 Tax=Streptomyces sp. NBC_01465 TaxID=2903878 RepID=UPI002E3460C0|nr:NAD(P)/FAD-dependent oxidoreductase [Streptomyces sp. NBC_01465]